MFTLKLSGIQKKLPSATRILLWLFPVDYLDHFKDLSNYLRYLKNKPDSNFDIL